MGTPLFSCFLLAGCDVISVTDRNPLLFSEAVCAFICVCSRRIGVAGELVCACVHTQTQHDLPANLVIHSVICLFCCNTGSYTNTHI